MQTHKQTKTKMREIIITDEIENFIQKYTDDIYRLYKEQLPGRARDDIEAYIRKFYYQIMAVTK